MLQVRHPATADLLARLRSDHAAKQRALGGYEGDCLAELCALNDGAEAAAACLADLEAVPGSPTAQMYRVVALRDAIRTGEGIVER